MGERARLAGAGPGDDQQRPAAVADGVRLLGRQAGQQRVVPPSGVRPGRGGCGVGASWHHLPVMVVSEEECGPRGAQAPGAQRGGARRRARADRASAAGDRLRPALGRRVAVVDRSAEQQRDERQRLARAAAAGWCSAPPSWPAMRASMSSCTTHDATSSADRGRLGAGGGGARRRRGRAGARVAEGLDDARAGARERRRRAARGPTARRQHRGEVVDRAARAAAGGCGSTSPARARAPTLHDGCVSSWPGTGQRHQPAARDA